MIEPMKEFEQQLLRRGVTPRTTYLYMHGHTLMDCVVLVALNAVCREAAPDGRGAHQRLAQGGRGPAQTRWPTTPIRCARSATCCSTTENYTSCPLYKRLGRDIGKVPPAHDPGHETPGRAARGFGDRHRPPLPAGVTLRGVPDAGMPGIGCRAAGEVPVRRRGANLRAAVKTVIPGR